MKKYSAGILVFRKRGNKLEVLIAHMGSPWWAKKDKGAWSIPKGEYLSPENPLEAAKREFHEELGLEVPNGELIDLGTIEQKNNKIVQVWAVEGDLDATETKSNTFEIEWPPKSGKKQRFEEIDRAGWFRLSEAREKLIPEQAEFLKRLAGMLGADFSADTLDEEEKPKQNSLF